MAKRFLLLLSCALAPAMAGDAATLPSINYLDAVQIAGYARPLVGTLGLYQMGFDPIDEECLVIDVGLYGGAMYRHATPGSTYTHPYDPYEFDPCHIPYSGGTHPATDPIRCANGDYLITDNAATPQVQRFASDGTPLPTGTFATATGIPRGQIAEDAQGNLWVQEDSPIWPDYQINQYSPTGVLLDTINNADAAGLADRTIFQYPGGMHMYNGRIYVCDGGRLLSFDPLNPHASMAVECAVPGDYWGGVFAEVGGIEIGADGRCYVIENHDVHVGEEWGIEVLDLNDPCTMPEYNRIQRIEDGAIGGVAFTPYIQGMGVDSDNSLYLGCENLVRIIRLDVPEADDDGDGVGNSSDLCPGTPPGTPVNAEGCPDADDDGVADTDDLCPGTPPGTQVNSDGCPDEDGDGVADADDLCPGTPVGVPVDADGCPFGTEFQVVLSDVTARGWGDYNKDGFSDMLGAGDVYTNQGNGAFVKTSPLSGIAMGTLGDWNNDGWLDAFDIVANGAPVLWLNDGDGTWTNRSDWYTAGQIPAGSNASTCADLNGDGYLDTYQTGWFYDGDDIEDVIYSSYSDGVSDPCWRFTATAPSRHAKGVTPCDFDEDGDQDLYVSGYWMSYGFLWRNDGFTGNQSDPTAGMDPGLVDVTIAYGVNDGPGHTQGSCWADFDNDGDFDLFVANFAHPGNPSARFMENQGAPDYHFTDKGLCGVNQVEPLSCGIAGDYDNDGDPDLLVTVSGGYGWTTIMMYRNDGNWTFTEVTSDVGLAGQGPEDVGAWGDYDNDGYVDLIANRKLWRNPGGASHWLKVKLHGGPHAGGLVNGAAIGTQVRIDVPGLGTLTRQVEGNTGQLGSQNDQTLHFGLGTYSGLVDLDILWPNGYQEIVYDVSVDQVFERTLGVADAPDADLNDDGFVDEEDLIILAFLWLDGIPNSDAGLVAHWKLNEASGALAADAVGGHTGTVIGTPSWYPDFGKYLGSLLISAGDYVQATGYKGITGSAPRTCSAWTKTPRNDGDIIFWGNTGPGLKWQVHVFGGFLRVSVGGGYMTGSTTISDNQWHLVTVVFDGTVTDDIELYVDGNPDPASAIGSKSISTGDVLDVWIGYGAGTGSAYFTGYVDDVRIYDRALSEEELALPIADLNQDGIVNSPDFEMLAAEWEP